MLSPQSQRDSWMSGSSEWRFATPLQSFSELPLPQTPTPTEEQRPQRPSLSTPQRQSFVEGNHRMSRSETQLFLQGQPTQQEVQLHRRSTSVDRQMSPAPRVRPLSQSWADINVPGPSSAPVITQEKPTSSMFTSGPTLFASAEGAHNTVWENVAANAAGSGAASTQPSRNERPTSVPRSSSSPPAGRVSPTKRGSSLFTGGPALYTVTAPAPISAEAAAAFEPSSSSPASQPHKSTLFTGGPTLYAAAPPPLDTSSYASTSTSTNYASTSTANYPPSTSNYAIASTSTVPPSSYTSPTTHVLSRRITEEELRSGSESGTEGGSSVDGGEKEEDVDEMIREGRLGVVENPKFSSSLPPPVNVPFVVGGAVASQGQAREMGEGQAGGAPQVQTQEPPRASADEARASPNKVVTGGVFGRRFSGFRNGQKRGRTVSDAGSVSVVGQTHARSEGVVGPQTIEPSQETNGAPVSGN